jgi:hypothetical protein
VTGRAPVAVALAVLLAGCTAGVPRDSTGQVTAAATTDAFSIKVGDCVGKLTGDTAEELTLVPCAEAHYWEAFAASNLTGEDFPGNSEIKDQSDKACTAAFEGFIGIAADDSKYEVTFLSPTRETWAQASDREVVCLVGDSSGGITGSLEGSRK